MGAYSSDELLPSGLREKIVVQIVAPTLQGLAANGICYQGFLYIGVMLTATGPKVLEFNCRLGDPETQAIVARMDFDLAEVLADVAAGRVDASKLKWKSGASACVVMTSGGYPGKFETGKEITGLREADAGRGVKVLHAGTKFDGDKIVTSGGRVLGVTAAGTNLDEALGRVYEAAQKIHFAGVHFRKDIGAHVSVSGGTINDGPTSQNPPSKKPRVGHPPHF
jgi:phosphoribosylamine--glycine ligase